MTELRKYLAIGRHGPVDEAVGRDVAGPAIKWGEAKLATGEFDCLYSMDGGGRLLIATAESVEQLMATLHAAPDVPRDWQITELFDGIEIMKTYLASLESEKAAPG